MKKIGIVGCGWLGFRIAKHLKPNCEIYTTTTSDEKNKALQEMGFTSIIQQFSDSEICKNQHSWEVLSQLDAIIITVPFPKRMGLDGLRNRFRNISSFIYGFEKQIFLMSSIGIYPNIELEIAENTLSEKDLEPTILSIEQLMKTQFPQLNILRLGGLMGDNRQLSNYKISEPEQIANHIHYQDICRIIEIMINRNLHSK
ncbi:MAG: epimerase, partial [Cruoricaptor ignavus]|nr:epimerase [Cruoricaptor ignavus]